MELGFKTIKDILDSVLTPVAIFLLGIFWSFIQGQYRCIRFKLLTRRELEEIGPCHPNPDPKDWTSYLTKEFVHQKIINDASANLDFILVLEPEFVYYLSQLWSAFETKDSGQWIHFLEKLSTHDYTKSKELTMALTCWHNVIDECVESN